MAFCRQCGAQLQENAHFCPACGTPVAQQTDSASAFTQPVNSVASDEVDPQDVQQNKVMAILSYFGILVLVPIFAAKESKFAKFHANQGLVLLIFSVGYGVVQGVVRSILLSVSYHLSFVATLLSLVYLVIFVFAIIGIVNAAGGKAKKLPLIGEIQILK